MRQREARVPGGKICPPERAGYHATAQQLAGPARA